MESKRDGEQESRVSKRAEWAREMGERDKTAVWTCFSYLTVHMQGIAKNRSIDCSIDTCDKIGTTLLWVRFSPPPPNLRSYRLTCTYHPISNNCRAPRKSVSQGSQRGNVMRQAKDSMHTSKVCIPSGKEESWLLDLCISYQVLVGTYHLPSPMSRLVMYVPPRFSELSVHMSLSSELTCEHSEEGSIALADFERVTVVFFCRQLMPQT